MNSEARKESVLKLLKKIPEAGKVALFYGFLPVESPKIVKDDFNIVKDFVPEWRPLEKVAILREFGELKFQNLREPLMLFYEKPFPGSGEKKKPQRIDYELVILGSQRSVCEAILIQATRAILDNAGWKDTWVRINSVGNKESISEYERKMSAFIRKRIADFPADLRQGLKKDPFYLIKSKDQKYKEWIEVAPQSIDYLSEDSRLHFKELLEFMEIAGFSYMIDPSLMGDTQYSTEAVFEIVSDSVSGEEVLGRGLRWNRLTKLIGLKKEIGAVSISINAKAFKTQKVSAMKISKPKFYLIQFGPEAKLKSFLVLEKLRKAGVAIIHSLGKDKLMGQISSVEQSSIPYIILLGQKEALDNVVVIRKTSTRAQYIVPINELGDFLKNSKEFV